MASLHVIFRLTRPWLLALACSVTAVHAADRRDGEAQDASALAREAARDGSGAVVLTPRGGESARQTSAARGRSVEMITGGNSVDGAATVGRLPVLE